MKELEELLQELKKQEQAVQKLVRFIFVFLIFPFMFLIDMGLRALYEYDPGLFVLITSQGIVILAVKLMYRKPSTK